MNPPNPPSPPRSPGAELGGHPAAPDVPVPGASEDPLDPGNFRHAKIRRQAAIYTKKIGDHYILYDPLENHYLRLNESAHALWTTVADHERIAVSEVIGQVGCDPDEGLAALIAMAERNFLVIVSL
ncbi:hypothetical protein PZ897_03960 [Hoeflea sp. YIM 152468]|uniref:hypothetical protein n=1 Tax=Hoeflea sp. YIM 152468 TaxID=3031759 RepID=UPI0023DBA4FD|nr:hypothetical protein [Hoeflea sp. YIM 152468]MDF1607327.1 hypothetical protein [Hoeflea sp. YIM 152468]